MINVNYLHNVRDHNLTAPSEIVPFIIDLVNPKSVVDVGCGTGTFLKIFEQEGLQDVLGIDGPWVNKSELFISEEKFLIADLEKGINLFRRFDLVLCLEVAEHLINVDTLVKTLCSLGDVIVFSAAVKGQGGQNHFNEQPFQFWVDKFKNYDFNFYDIFRPVFWNNQKVNWWYRQNMFLIVKSTALINQDKISTYRRIHIDEYIHPELFHLRTAEAAKYKQKLNWLYAGAAPCRFYLSLLKKKIKNVFGKAGSK